MPKMSSIRTLPYAFRELDQYVADWAYPTRQERYAARLSKPIGELERFYDAIAPRAEQAVEHLTHFDLTALPEPEALLLQLLHSLTIVSYPVNSYRQPQAG